MQPTQKQVGIIGAGISGLLACKHALEKGLNPIVFESYSTIGGVWSRGAIDSTNLQTPKTMYRFTDVDWPETVTDTFPSHHQVRQYLNSYAERFGLLPWIRFNSRVTEIDFVGEKFEDVTRNWLDWGGSGEPFSPRGRWVLTVENTVDTDAPPQVYQVDFVVLCIGMFSDLPRVPDFPPGGGPEVFDGKVLHSMDYAMMDREHAAELVKDKRVVVVGFQKAAVDIATEISQKNGKRHPCTLLFRSVLWTLPDYLIKILFTNLNRAKEYMIHKPHEGLFLWFLAMILTPLMWIFTKLLENYLKWIYPLRKYNMVPSHGLIKQFRSCMTPLLPGRFYGAVDEGSILLKKSRSFKFCKNGLIVDGPNTTVLLEADVVVFATGFESEEKLKNIFASTYFQKCIMESSAPLYRGCIHPRIPQLAILGYGDSTSVLHGTEMRSKWLAHFLAGNLKLPTIKEMEEDVTEWERCFKRYSEKNYKRFHVNVLLQMFCNDQICKDMKCNPRRKGCLLKEMFAPYGPIDYQNLTSEA